MRPTKRVRRPLRLLSSSFQAAALLSLLTVCPPHYYCLQGSDQNGDVLFQCLGVEGVYMALQRGMHEYAGVYKRIHAWQTPGRQPVQEGRTWFLSTSADACGRSAQVIIEGEGNTT